MGNTDKLINQYKDFLEEKYGLGPEDLRVLIKFNQELEEDVDLLEAVEEYFEQKNKSQAFRQTLGELNGKYFSDKQVTIDLPAALQEKKKAYISFKRLGRIAAVLTLLAGGSIVFYYTIGTNLGNEPVLSIVEADKTIEIPETVVKPEVKSPAVTEETAGEKTLENNPIEHKNKDEQVKAKKLIKRSVNSTKLNSKENVVVKGLANGRKLYIKGDYLGCLSALKDVNKTSEDYEEARRYMRLALGDLEEFGLLPKEMENEFKQISASATNSDEKIEALTKLTLTSFESPDN